MAVLLITMMGFYLVDAQEQRTSIPRPSNDLPIRRAQVEQELSKSRAVEQDLKATLDRAQLHRHDARENMVKAYWANLAGVYKKSGKVAC